MTMSKTHRYVENKSNHYFQIPEKVKFLALELAQLHLACNILDLQDDNDTINVNDDYFNNHPLVSMLINSKYADSNFSYYSLESLKFISDRAFSATIEFQQELELPFSYQGQTALSSIYNTFKECIGIEKTYPVFAFKACIAESCLGSLGIVAQAFYDLVISHEAQDFEDHNVVFHNMIETLSALNINPDLKYA